MSDINTMGTKRRNLLSVRIVHNPSLDRICAVGKIWRQVKPGFTSV